MTNGNDQMITDRKFNARNNSFGGRAEKRDCIGMSKRKKNGKCHFKNTFHYQIEKLRNGFDCY